MTGIEASNGAENAAETPCETTKMDRICQIDNESTTRTIRVIAIAPIDINHPDTYRNDSRLYTKVPKLEDFFTTPSKHKGVTNLESHDMPALLQTFMCPRVYFFLSQFGTPRQLSGHLDFPTDKVQDFL